VCGALPVNFGLPGFWIFAVLGMGLAGTDLRRNRLPYALTVTLFFACAAAFIAEATRTGDFGPLARAAVVGALATAGLLALALALPGQIGLGDVTFAGAITFSLGWLSWQAATGGLLVGLLVQGVVVLAVKALARNRATLPLGPALITGWLLAVVLTG
jgi:leader peptidase (prepilin peptidase)/N-methyltransferase